MGKRKRKNKTHVTPTEEEASKIPQSFVMRSGPVGTSVTALVRDFRQVLKPHTASHLKERRSNRLKDFVSVAGLLGVTHFVIFNRTEKSVNLRIARVPRGPTLNFRVVDYALTKDCVALQKNPRTSELDYAFSPLLVLNNFQQQGKEFKVMTAMLQNMFPSVDVQTMSLSHTKRILLFNYNEDTETIDVRHYSIGVKTTGVSKSIKRVINTHLPDLSKFDDISDYVLREAIVSESDVEDGPESNVTLPEDYTKNSRKNEQRAVRLQELGPRMTLQLTKVENGLCDGEILYHRYIKKTQSEINENERKRQRTLKAKEARKKQQEQNVEKKKADKEALKKQKKESEGGSSSEEE